MAGILGGAASGAATGAMLGPLGAAIGGTIGLGFGIADRIKGKRKLKEATSFYEEHKKTIPEAAKAALGSAERGAQGFRLPGEDIRRSQIAQATAGGVGAAQQAATSSSDVLAIMILSHNLQELLQ